MSPKFDSQSRQLSSASQPERAGYAGEGVHGKPGEIRFLALYTAVPSKLASWHSSCKQSGRPLSQESVPDRLRSCLIRGDDDGAGKIIAAKPYDEGFMVDFARSFPIIHHVVLPSSRKLAPYIAIQDPVSAGERGAVVRGVADL